MGPKDVDMSVGELDEASRQKAELRFFNYYQLYIEPDPNAQGPASFH